MSYDCYLNDPITREGRDCLEAGRKPRDFQQGWRGAGQWLEHTN